MVQRPRIALLLQHLTQDLTPVRLVVAEQCFVQLACIRIVVAWLVEDHTDTCRDRILLNVNEEPGLWLRIKVVQQAARDFYRAQVCARPGREKRRYAQTLFFTGNADHG